MRLYPLLLIATFASLVACTKSSNSIDPGPTAKAEARQEISPSNYLSGQAFCAHYSKITSKEISRSVTVPRDYGDFSAGAINLYAYTMKPFDPALPSYVFVDGGPAQNTHGDKPLLAAGFNEIRFDQRGVGCSAPENYDSYTVPALYSTANTVRDMDAIRAAYGLQQWSIYGVSYGTVPATIYASQYPQWVRSVVLEGTIGPVELVHSWAFFADRANQSLALLTPAERISFSKIMHSSREHVSVILGLMSINFMSEEGVVKTAKSFRKLMSADGSADEKAFALLRKFIEKHNHPDGPAQQPFAIDGNIEDVIHCRDIGLRERLWTIDYSDDKGFFEKVAQTAPYAARCDRIGILQSDETTYRYQDQSIAVPVYYFQGALDSATIPEGAFKHWKAVPKGQSYFMLAANSGHNPDLARLHSKNLDLAAEQSRLMNKALLGVAIDDSDIAAVNKFAATGEEWTLLNSAATTLP